ncbi:MAG: tetratricopeptide repeat protein [Syntrophobacteraceae bacterium]
MKRPGLVLFVTVILAAYGLPLYAADLNRSEIAAAYYKSYEHERSQSYESAIQDLSAIYTGNPNDYLVNYRMGWLYYLGRNYSEAIKHLNKALAVSPQSIEVMNTIIPVYSARADWPKVEAKSMAVLKIDFYNLSANYWYSHSLRMEKKYGPAIQVDRKMLTVYPTSATFLQELGENLFLDNKKEESLSVFRKLKLLWPSNAVADQYLNKLEAGGQ